jgi:N-acetylmuramoyl-L-alanine amidase
MFFFPAKAPAPELGESAEIYRALLGLEETDPEEKDGSSPDSFTPLEVPPSPPGADTTIMMVRSETCSVVPVRRKLAEYAPENADLKDSKSRWTAIVHAILSGPTEEEQALGIKTGLGRQARLSELAISTTNSVTVRFEVPARSDGAPRLTPHQLHHFADQVHRSLMPEGVREFHFQVKDARTGQFVEAIDLFREQPDDPSRFWAYRNPDSHIPATKADSPGEVTAAAQSLIQNNLPALPGPGNGGALNNVAVVLNPGHGWVDDGSRWRVQRSKLWDNLEDFGNAETFMHYLAPALLNAGARVQPVRELDAQTNMVIVDNGMGSPQYVETGSWSTSTANGFVMRTGASWNGTLTNPWGNANATRFVATVNGTPTATATYTVNVPATGFYNVYISWSSGTNRTSSAHWQVRHSGGNTSFRVNQQRDGATWFLLGNFHFVAGSPENQRQIVALNDSTAGGLLTVDAVRIGGGMGDVARRANGISGRARWSEEACNYLQFTGMLASTLMSGDNTSGLNDEQLGWGNRPQFANWEQARDNEGTATVYLGWHTNAFNGGCSGGTEQNGTARGSGVFRDTDARAIPRTVALATAMNTAYVNAMRRIYNLPTWQDRGITASSGYGESSQPNLGNVAGVFFEALFHDNQADTQIYLDPKMRETAARAMVQGLISFNGGTVFPPETPVRPRVTHLGNGQARIEWEPGPVRTDTMPFGSAATTYRVYFTQNGYGFDNGVNSNGQTSLIIDAPPGQTLMFHIRAVNSAGVSFPTEVLAVRTPAAGQTPVLLVNAYNRFDRFLPPLVPAVQGCANNLVRSLDPRRFNSRNYAIQHADALAAAGVAFDTASEGAIEAGRINLANYRTVIWASGQEAEVDSADPTNDTAIKPNARTAIQNFLIAGGNLFISGSEIAWNYGRTNGPTQAERDWLQNNLRATLTADSAFVYTATPTAGGVFDSVGPITFDDGTGDTYNVRFPDVLAPLSGATTVLNYGPTGTNGIAAIEYFGPVASSPRNARVLFLGFPFETIRAVNTRRALMAAALTSFGETPGSIWNRLPNSMGWAPFQADVPGLQQSTHSTAQQALLATVFADPQNRFRLSGWFTNDDSNRLPVQSTLNGQWVRAKFSVYLSGTTLQNAPQIRMRVSNRFAINSMLEVTPFVPGDSEQNTLAADFSPSFDANNPSVYRVDMAPILVPFLINNPATEGYLRGVEILATEPNHRGTLHLTDSSIATYAPPALNTANRIKQYLPERGDFASVFANRLKYQIAPDFSSFSEDLSEPRPIITFGANQGINLDTSIIPASRTGLALADLITGAAEDSNPALRARVEENRIYAIRFHATSNLPSTNQAQIRFRARTAKFAWSQKLELGGAWAIGTNSAGGNAAIAQQALPGVGSLNPVQRTPGSNGGWYTMVMHSPLNREIRGDFPNRPPLTTSMPNLATQDAPGQNNGRPRRDINLGIDILDSISFGGPNQALEQGQVLLDQVEIHSLPMGIN